VGSFALCKGRVLDRVSQTPCGVLKPGQKEVALEYLNHNSWETFGSLDLATIPYESVTRLLIVLGSASGTDSPEIRYGHK